MKKMLRLLIALTILVGAASTTSLADGGAPFPTCSPWHCPTGGGGGGGLTY
jgi:hypothetical protein